MGWSKWVVFSVLQQRRVRMKRKRHRTTRHGQQQQQQEEREREKGDGRCVGRGRGMASKQAGLVWGDGSSRDVGRFEAPPPLPISAATKHPPPKATATLLQKMQMRLIGGQFRMLNEKLYTCSGDDALKLFQDDPTAFQLYHAGYQEQMSQWPHQPVEIIIKWLQNHSQDVIVADFGCGDGRLARSVQNKVFSLDLVALDPSIIACNMAHTPLRAASIDVAVFCLSLMGTDYSEFLKEAHRLLKPRGLLLIAEVKSRFDPRTGGTDPQLFIQAVTRLGFSLVLKDFSDKMFIMFQFQIKMGSTMAVNDIDWPVLKPCIYKRR